MSAVKSATDHSTASHSALPVSNLVVSAIIHWNTVYLAKAADYLKAQGCEIPDHLLRHVSPLTWEHINLTGIYAWADDTPQSGEYRPLRETEVPFQLVA